MATPINYIMPQEGEITVIVKEYIKVMTVKPNEGKRARIVPGANFKAEAIRNSEYKRHMKELDAQILSLREQLSL
jgi:hypothetical protein